MKPLEQYPEHVRRAIEKNCRYHTLGVGRSQRAEPEIFNHDVAVLVEEIDQLMDRDRRISAALSTAIHNNTWRRGSDLVDAENALAR
jgi:hypothetical protein